MKNLDEIMEHVADYNHKAHLVREAIQEVFTALDELNARFEDAKKAKPTDIKSNLKSEDLSDDISDDDDDLDFEV